MLKVADLAVGAAVVAQGRAAGFDRIDEDGADGGETRARQSASQT